MINGFFTLSPFLPVQGSLWPLLSSVLIFSMLANIVIWVALKLSFWYVASSGSLLLIVILLWWKDLKRESFIGYHTHNLELCLRMAMLLFILSEIFFFLSFFWAFYDASLSPVVELGLVWPPNGIIPLSAFSVPLLNTIILLSSGATITWAHHSIINNFFKKSVLSLSLTVVLGVYFLGLQWLEYSEALFSISDGVFGSTFFMATGFHGFHVIVGTSFLFYVLLSLVGGGLLHSHHFSFEAAAWYWHFVDVVWLFLYLSVYFWGSL